MIINYNSKKIQVKLVYYGAAMSGKTTSLRSVFKKMGKGEELTSIETTTGRTLFFDFGTLSFKGADWDIEILVYSATGQDFYASTRPATLQGADGIIFVIDSQREHFDDNIYSWNELEYFYGESMKGLSMVLCFNKMDLEDRFDQDELLSQIDLNHVKNHHIIKTIATDGCGTQEAFSKAIEFVFPSVQIVS